MAELEATDWKYLRTFRLIVSSLEDGLNFVDLSFRSKTNTAGEFVFVLV